jgi:hypothetical protein
MITRSTARFGLILSTALAVSPAPAQTPTFKPQQRKLFTAKTSTEARLTYRHAVLLEGFSSQPDAAAAKDAAEGQAQYLFGALYLSGSAKPLGAPKQVADVKVTGVKKAGEGRWQVSYDYSGVIQLEKDGQDQGTLKFPLPRDPDGAWHRSRELNPNATGPCADGLRDHDDPSFFWYVFNPRNPKCKLQAGQDYDVVTGSFKRLPPPSKPTYPEYARLVRTQNGKQSIRIDMLMGVASEPELGPQDYDADGRFRFDPFKPGKPGSSDVTSQSFRMIAQGLQQGANVLGVKFKSRRWTDQEIEKVAGKLGKVVPFVADFTYVTPAGSAHPGIEITVRMYEGVTTVGAMGADSFYGFLKDSYETGGVMMYSGHSSLGRGLNLAEIESWMNVKLQPDCKNYQIYFFNGCSSYGYYNQDYFARKAACGNGDAKGTRNLDVLTNGLETYFVAMPKGDAAVIQSIIHWALGKGVRSYQSLANEIDSVNLFGVNGDEDPGNLQPTP